MKNANISVKLFALLLISTQEVVKRYQCTRKCSVEGKNESKEPKDLIYPTATAATKTTTITATVIKITKQNRKKCTP